MILLDTHALVWMDQNMPALGENARQIIQNAWDAHAVAVGAISFWECAMLHKARRLELPASSNRWRMELLEAGLIEIPIDGATAMLAVSLDLLHKDPADRLITATAIARNATLITADAKILQWVHPLKRHDASI
ncbi:MAG: type II toxin-antitoxin system VapC family toxin [Halothiobacillaceae bacterium]